MTSSAILTEPQKAQTEQSSEPFLQPWQFFLLGGMLAATATVIVATGQSPANIIILSITVVAVSFVGLGAYRILSPLVSTQPEQPITIGGRTRVALEREKMLVLRSIKELEFDHAMGKLSTKDFDEMSGRLRTRALSLMRELELDPEGYKTSIERELEGRLKSAKIAPAAPAVTNACASCHAGNDADAVFCKKCGARIAA